MYLYSDGITDAMNTAGAQFGAERLLDVLGQGRGMSLEDSVSELLRRVEHWAGDARLKDDVSFLGFEIVDAAKK